MHEQVTNDHLTIDEPELTPREREILALVRAGRTNAEIADKLGISRDGVRYHLKELHSKLATEGDRHQLRRRRTGSLGGVFAGLLTLGRPMAATAAVAGVSVAGYFGVMAAQSPNDHGDNTDRYCTGRLVPTIAGDPGEAPAPEPSVCADSPSELLAEIYRIDGAVDAAPLPGAYCAVEFSPALAAAVPSPAAQQPQLPTRESGWGDPICADSPAQLSRLLHDNQRLADAIAELHPSAYCVELYSPGVTPRQPGSEPISATCADTADERYRVLHVMQDREDGVYGGT